MNDFEERMLRLNGQKPTMRDRWQCFYRLWRLSHGQGVYQDMDAENCFSVLLYPPPWQILLKSEANDGLVDSSHIPAFLRRRLFESRKRRRLYNGHHEWAERDKRVANMVRNEHGIEVTPDEVAETRRKVISMARQKAFELGLKVPSDDEQLLRMLKS